MGTPFAAKANDLSNILFAGFDDPSFVPWEKRNGLQVIDADLKHDDLRPNLSKLIIKPEKDLFGSLVTNSEIEGFASNSCGFRPLCGTGVTVKNDGRLPKILGNHQLVQSERIKASCIGFRIIVLCQSKSRKCRHA